MKTINVPLKPSYSLSEFFMKLLNEEDTKPSTNDITYNFLANGRFMLPRLLVASPNLAFVKTSSTNNTYDYKKLSLCNIDRHSFQAVINEINVSSTYDTIKALEEEDICEVVNEVFYNYTAIGNYIPSGKKNIIASSIRTITKALNKDGVKLLDKSKLNITFNLDSKQQVGYVVVDDFYIPSILGFYLLQNDSMLVYNMGNDRLFMIELDDSVFIYHSSKHYVEGTTPMFKINLTN